MNWLTDQNSFLAWESRSRDTIEVKRCYVDVAGGDLIAGILLSQIIYWHLPDHEGQPRLRIEREGYKWLAKKRDDWWKECRITPKQFDTAIKLLESKNLIVTALYKFGNSPTKHIRIDWENFLELLNLVVQTPPLAPEHIKTQVASGFDEKVNFRKGENGIAKKVKMDFPKRLNSNCRKGENDLIDTEITSEITHNAPLASPPAPPTQESVCEKEELDLTTKEIQLEEPTPEKPSLEKPTPEEPTPKQLTSLSKNSESLQQTDNPSCRPTIAVGSFDKNEQSNKLKKPKFQSIEDLIDMVLVDPSIMATDSLPAVYRAEIKMRNWRFPWRTAIRDKIYQTCDRRLVELIAKHRAKWGQGESWQEKIPTVLKSISNLEGSKAGLEELMGYWSQVVEPEATSELTKQQPDEKQPIGYFANRSLDWHKSTFSEFLDRVDEVGEDKARVSFSTRYDQQSPGATDKWLEWIKLTHPSMYLHLHSNAA
ncbi:MAG: hypothetical protein V7K38_27405 [Nostoc sp.]|uniref:hypothetical protein n=1 Tax=Nostoc sp. TaxID=1180 RepID=UPI002FF4849D